MHSIAHLTIPSLFHMQKIVHRDLKPANVFASGNDDGSSLHFKIGDFGLSQLIRGLGQQGRQQSPTDSGVTREGIAENIHISPEGDDHGAWQDPLTAGVGTASYAAPEQVTTRNYGKEADIFSLGLILLELLCCFSTEHERLQTFQDCRHKRVLPDEISEFPVAVRTILSCTEPDPKKRPSAVDLVNVNLKDETPNSSSEVDGDFDVHTLLRQLTEKDKLLEEYKQQLEEKERIIHDLRRNIQTLTERGSPSRTQFRTMPTSESSTRLSCPRRPPSSSSSSEDEL